MDSIKLAVISSQALKTPPLQYGGLERVAYEHARGLQELGHEVTLIATDGSKAPPGVELIECGKSWDALNQAQQKHFGDSDGIDREWNGLKWKAHTWNGWRAHEEEAFKHYKDRLGSFDVVSDLSWSKWSYSSKKEEIIGTCHSIQPYNSVPRPLPMFTGVSRPHSRSLSKNLHVPVRTLWNPVNIEEFPLVHQKVDRVLSLNRIMPQKGIHLTVQLAEELKVKTDIAGDDSTLVPDQGYVNQIKQACAKSGVLSYHGLVDAKKRIQLLSDAKVLVAFKDAGYEEVFGLSLVEALACGTPVVSARTWGAEDIIIPNKNGVIVNDLNEAKKAVQSIMSGSLRFSADECRQSVERFDRKVIAKQMEKMLISVKSGTRW